MQQSRPRNVIVVDDERPFRELMATLLSRLGHRCRTVPDAANALREIERSDFDLAIIDLHMPQMKGDELAQEIKKRWFGLPILLMTGDRAWNGNGLPSIDKVLLKPFSIEQLRDALGEMRVRASLCWKPDLPANHGPSH